MTNNTSNFTISLLSSLSISLASGLLSASILQHPNPTPQAIDTLTTSNQICYAASTTSLGLLSLKRRRKPD